MKHNPYAPPHAQLVTPRQSASLLLTKAMLTITGSALGAIIIGSVVDEALLSTILIVALLVEF